MDGAISKSWASIFAGTQTLGEYFGAPLQDVSDLNRYIAIYAGRPDWLRGVVHESGLPRRIMNDKLKHRFTAPATEGERANLVVWIVETGLGEWNISDRWVWFDHDVDAVHFSLRFC